MYTSLKKFKKFAASLHSNLCGLIVPSPYITARILDCILKSLTHKQTGLKCFTYVCMYNVYIYILIKGCVCVG